MLLVYCFIVSHKASTFLDSITISTSGRRRQNILQNPFVACFILCSFRGQHICKWLQSVCTLFSGGWFNIQARFLFFNLPKSKASSSRPLGTWCSFCESSCNCGHAIASCHPVQYTFSSFNLFFFFPSYFLHSDHLRKGERTQCYQFSNFR